MRRAHPLSAMRRLQKRGPNCRGLAVDRDGVVLGPHAVLVQRGDRCYRCAPTDDIIALARAAFGTDARVERLPATLAAIAGALDASDLVKAQLLALSLPMGVLDDVQLQRLAAAADLLKVGFDPNQPRDERGRWRDTGGAGALDEGHRTGVEIAEAGDGRSDVGGILPATEGQSGSPPKLGVDSVLLRHRGDKENSENTLRVAFDHGSYVVGLLVSNEDTSAWPTIDALRDEFQPLNVEIDATIKMNGETYSRHYTWSISLPVGGTAHAGILKDIAPLKGPSTVEMHVKNLGPYDTGVTLRVTKVD